MGFEQINFLQMTERRRGKKSIFFFDIDPLSALDKICSENAVSPARIATRHIGTVRNNNMY